MNEHYKTVFALFLTALAITEVTCSYKFLLLHTNDMHANYEEVDSHTLRCRPSSDKCYGGFARLRAAVRRFTEEAEKKGMPTVYLDAGDVFHGTVFYTEFKWKLAVKMMNLLRPQAMTIGNNEFNDGIEGLAPFVKEVQVPVVCSNIDTSGEPSLKVKPSTVITLGEAPNAARIGIVGYLSRDVSEKKLGNVKILNEIESLKTETKRLRNEEHVDIIIALGQGGYEMDKKIAEAVEDIDVIVGGHSHSLLYNGKPPLYEKVRGPYPTFIEQKSNGNKRIPIVQASYGTKYLGYLELEFDDNWKLKDCNGLPVLLTGDMPQDNEVLIALQPEASIIARKYSDVIGHTEFTLRGGSSNCKFRECNIGDMITDALVDYVNKNYQTDNGKPVTVGLIHSGAIRGSLLAQSKDGYTGDITKEDLLTALPFKMSLEVLEMKGSDLRFLLESSMDMYDPKRGVGGLFRAGLLQVSGLKLKYDLTMKKGRRLWSAAVAPKYQGIADQGLYNVVMPDYLAKSYNILANQKRVVAFNKEETVYSVVENFIRQQKVFKKGEKYSETEGRISISFDGWIKAYYSQLMYYIRKRNPYEGLGG